MLFNLSLKNIRKSFKDYAIYFFTLILGVAIFYIFNSLESQTVMLKLNSSTKDIIKLMNNVLSGVSVFVSFILGFLIVYANQFLMKRRKKEFGIYMILGMSKKQISKILLVETITIGLISLVIGLVLGVALSQVMSIVVANMFEADMTKFTFVFSLSAWIKTMIYFGIMYLLVMVFNTIQVNRQQLIKLLTANRQNEEVKLKNTYLCIGIFIGAVVLLSYAYYNVTAGAGNLTNSSSVLFQMIYGAVATFLIYWSISGLILKFVMASKNYYFKNLNSFTVKQISSKINTTVLSTTVICLMLFLTICIFSSAFALNNSATEEINELAPVDIQMQKDVSVDNLSITKYLSQKQIGLDDLKNIYTFMTYRTSQLTYRDTFGSAFKDVSESYLNNCEDIIKLSDYNKLAKIYNLPTYDLKDEYVVMGNYENLMFSRNQFLKEKPAIELNGKIYQSKFDKCQNVFLSMQSSHMCMGVYIVPDEAVSNFIPADSYLVGNYAANDQDTRNEVDEKMHSYSSDVLLINTRIQISSSSVSMGAMVIFIGLYIGIVFLISCAAILALKELSQSIDNKGKYQILRNVGVDEKMINRSLFKQIAVYFAFPLILALIHSIFGIQVCNIMLQTFNQANVFDAIITTGIFLVIIYGGYFIITYQCSKSIIKDK